MKSIAGALLLPSFLKKIFFPCQTAYGTLVPPPGYQTHDPPPAPLLWKQRSEPVDHQGSPPHCLCHPQPCDR